MQPRGVKGASASKTSLIEPMHASSRCGTKPSSARRAPRAVVGMHLEPGVDEGADQPAPHRALVIGRVARAQVAVVARLVVGVAGRERAQADRREQLRARRRAPAPSARGRAPGAAARWRRPGWAGTRVVAAARRRRRRRRGSRRRRYQKRSLNDCRARARAVIVGAARRRRPPAAPALHQPQRVVPERVDLDRLAAPRRHDPVADLGVHPGELIALGALAQQAVAPDRRRCRSACRARDASMMSLQRRQQQRAASARSPVCVDVAIDRVEEPQSVASAV